MSKAIKRIGVLTSGGAAPGMNAALRAVVRTSAFHSIECIGIYRGYQGLIDNDVKLMNARSVNNIINKGGTILKSARCLEFRTKKGRKIAFETIKKNKIQALIVIGGDGSFTGAIIFQSEFNKLSTYKKWINWVTIHMTSYVPKKAVTIMQQINILKI